MKSRVVLLVVVMAFAIVVVSYAQEAQAPAIPQMPQISAEDLVTIIGEKEVQIRRLSAYNEMLKGTIQQLQAENEKLKKQ